MGWKLVRDGNEAWCRANGVSGQWRVSPDPLRALARKLGEEALEYAESLDPAELYDLFDVLAAAMTRADPDGRAAAAHWAKTQEFGTFGACTEWTPVPPGSSDWAPDAAEGAT